MKAKDFAKLQARWDLKLAKSGFQDLEGRDRDQPLSNRGKLHDGSGKTGDDMAVGPGTQVDGDWQTFVHRVSTGAQHTDRMWDIYHRLPENGIEARFRKRVWGAYAEGNAMKTIAADMGENFHRIRNVINDIEERQCPQSVTLEQAVRLVDNRTLIRVTAALLVACKRATKKS